MTPARKYALAWFALQEVDLTASLFHRRPSTKMCRLMLREGQLYNAPSGIGGLTIWRLTPIGRSLIPTPAGEGANASPAIFTAASGRP
jgi:hypothetical protein